MKSMRGFTLVELAVALLIVGLLLAGALIPLSSQLELTNIANTQRTMDEIKQALLGFVQVNGRLPCPARGQTPDGTTDSVTWAPASFAAGAEQLDSTTNYRCYTVTGVLPWATLGVPETDAWGRRFTYRVSAAFADFPPPTNLTPTIESRGVPAGGALGTTPQTYRSTPASPADQSPTCPPPSTLPTTASFVLCSLGDIAVYNRDESTHAAMAQAAGVPAIVIAHGRNGYGAFKPDGQRIIGTNDLNADGVPDQNVDEAANVNGTTTIATTVGQGAAYLQYVYYNRVPAGVASGCSDPTAGSPLCEFDDIVMWISQPLLASRMVSAGKLP